MKVLKEFEFDAAHYLPSYNGKCDDAEGMVMDFTKLKHTVQDLVLSRLDHHLLNDLLPNPSAENIAIWVWNKLAGPLSGPDRRLCEVQVWETRTSGCIYNGEFYEGELC